MKSFKDIFYERTSFDTNFQSEEFFDDFYDSSDISEQDKKMHPQYKGRNVIWMGYDEDRVRKVEPEYVTPREDNIFIPEKIKAVKDRIRDVSGGADTLYLYTPVAEQSKITIEDVQNTQMADESGQLRMEYAMDEPFSTGDYEVDEFLRKPEEWVEHRLSGTGVDFDDARPYLMEDGPILKQDYKNGKWEEDDYETLKEFIDEYSSMQKEIEKIEEKGKGDVGKLWYRLRDGNHRAFGALAAGEPFVYVTVAKNSSLV